MAQLGCSDRQPSQIALSGKAVKTRFKIGEAQPPNRHWLMVAT
jgi:hypothetical protein